MKLSFTSALRMHRSIADFQKLGMTVSPVACDFRAYVTVPPPFSVFLRQHNVDLLALYAHELFGRWAYGL